MSLNPAYPWIGWEEGTGRLSSYCTYTLLPSSSSPKMSLASGQDDSLLIVIYQHLGVDPLELEMATHSSILAWRILMNREPDGLPSVVSQSQTRLSAHACVVYGTHWVYVGESNDIQTLQIHTGFLCIAQSRDLLSICWHLKQQAVAFENGK